MFQQLETFPALTEGKSHPTMDMECTRVETPTVLAAQWKILTSVQENKLDSYTLQVGVLWPGAINTPPLTLQGNLSLVQEIPADSHITMAQLPALLDHIVRVQGTQQYAVIVRNIHPVRVSVKLTDPQGQTTTQQGQTS